MPCDQTDFFFMREDVAGVLLKDFRKHQVFEMNANAFAYDPSINTSFDGTMNLSIRAFKIIIISPV